MQKRSTTPYSSSALLTCYFTYVMMRRNGVLSGLFQLSDLKVSNRTHPFTVLTSRTAYILIEDVKLSQQDGRSTHGHRIWRCTWTLTGCTTQFLLESRHETSTTKLCQRTFVKLLSIFWRKNAIKSAIGIVTQNALTFSQAYHEGTLIRSISYEKTDGKLPTCV